MGIERMVQLSLLLGRPHLASQAASVFVRCTSSSHFCFNPGSGLFLGVVEGVRVGLEQVGKLSRTCHQDTLKRKIFLLGNSLGFLLEDLDFVVGSGN